MITFRRPVALTVAAAGLSIATAAAGFASAPEASATDSLRPLTSYLIAPSVIGSGFKRVTYQEGSTLKDTTLQFCGRELTSDAQRADRLQVGFYPIRGKQPQFSEEIIRYKPGKGSSAREDLAKLAHLCPREISFGNAAGGTTTTQITAVHLAGVPKGGLAFTDYEDFVGGTQPGGPYVTTEVYLTRGDVLIGLYRDTFGKPATVAAMSRAAANRLGT